MGSRHRCSVLLRAAGVAGGPLGWPSLRDPSSTLLPSFWFPASLALPEGVSK